MRKKDKEGIQGATFGVMEATIMMLGVMTGLSVTGNKFIVAIGLLTAGLADAIANAVGFHVSEETETFHTKREVWKSMLYAFLGTLVTITIMALPVIFLQLKQAVVTTWVIGIIILMILGYSVSKIAKREKPLALMLEYTAFGVFAAVLCYALGLAVIYFFNSI